MNLHSSEARGTWDYGCSQLSLPVQRRAMGEDSSWKAASCPRGLPGLQNHKSRLLATGIYFITSLGVQAGAVPLCLLQGLPDVFEQPARDLRGSQAGGGEVCRVVLAFAVFSS